MKDTVVRHILLLTPVLFAVAAAVLLITGAGNVDATATAQPAMMSIPF